MATIIAPPGQPKPMQPSDYTPAAQSQVVSWQLKRLPPPSSLYVGVDDVLRVAAASSQAAEVVTVNYRLLRAADAVVVVGQFTVAPGSSRAVAVQDQQLAEGFLLSASCQAAVATSRGQTFARLLLNPKALGAGQPAQMLMADYVTTAMAPAHPNGRVLAPSEGPGNLVAYAIAQPLAGVELIVASPTNARWRIGSLTATLTTANAGANRIATLFVQPQAGANTYQCVPSLLQALNTTNVYYGGNVSTPQSTNVSFGPHLWTWPIDQYLRNGGALTTLTSGFNAADQWSTIVIAVEEWLDNV